MDETVVRISLDEIDEGAVPRDRTGLDGEALGDGGHRRR